MNVLKSISFAASIVFLISSAKAEDLRDVFHAAQSQDVVFASAQAARRAAQEKLPQGRSLLLPSINFGANTTYNDNSVHYHGSSPFSAFLPSGAAHYNSYGYVVSLTQPLFREQNRIAYSEAELQVALSEVQFRIAEQDLILRVAQAYFDVLSADDSVQLAQAQKKAITEQRDQAKRNFEVGTSTITDTYEAEARFDLIFAQEIAAQSNFEVKNRALQQLTNAMPGQLKHLKTVFELDETLTDDVEKWVTQSQLRNLQVAVTQIGAELAGKEVARNHAGNYPSIDLVASYANNSTGGGALGLGSDNNNKTLGIQLNLPLYQGGAIQSKSREAEALRDRANEDLENARRNVAVQTRQAYLGVVNGIAQVKALTKALKSSESLLEASKLGQEVGVRTNLDVLNAQQQLYSTKRDLYQAEYNVLLSQLRLKAASGILSEDELKRLNHSLN